VRKRRELRVLASGVEKRLALLPDQDALDLAEKHRVRAVIERLHDAAIEARERIREHRRAGRQVRPLAYAKA